MGPSADSLSLFLYHCSVMASSRREGRMAEAYARLGLVASLIPEPCLVGGNKPDTPAATKVGVYAEWSLVSALDRRPSISMLCHLQIYPAS